MTEPPALLQIKKYSNRRLYDQTRGRHLTHAELFDLVARGSFVRVTDGSTGADITNVVLAQVLLERDPIKLAAFPPALMHQIIRASEQMLSSFSARYLGQIIDSYAAMQRQLESVVGRAGRAGTALPGALFDWALALSQPGAGASPGAPQPDVAELHARLERLTQELDDLRARPAAKPRRARPAPSAKAPKRTRKQG